MANAYHDHRVEQRLVLGQGGIQTLEARFTKEQKEIELAQAKLDDLRKGLQIPDAIGNGASAATLLSDEKLRKIEALRLEGKTDLDKKNQLTQAKEARAGVDSQRGIH